MLYKLIIIVQVLSALAIIVLVLMQHGKGADMGSAFGAGGSGGSGSLFGASGSSTFLSKSTAAAAVVFFLATLAMAYLGPYRAPVQSGVIEKLQSVTESSPEQPSSEAVEAAKHAAGKGAIPGVVAPVPSAPVQKTSK